MNQLIIALINPKSPSNVGSVMRASGCYGVDEVFYSGNRYGHAAKFATDTQNASNEISLIREDDLLAQVPDGFKIVCVELVEGAVSLPIFNHPKKGFYIFGPEDGTINQKIISHADAVVYIPTKGCMNLAATVNVLLYDRLAKTENIKADDELIRASRDVNNRTKVV